MKRDLGLLGLAVIIGAIIGLIVGWGLWRPRAPQRETPAAAVKQGDGSVILERRPESAPAPPPHELPAGGKEERRVSVSIQPRAKIKPVEAVKTPGATPSSSGGEIVPGRGEDAATCPPVRVDLSLVKMPDQSRRVVASSPDGDVVGGLDIPIEPPARAFKPTRWAAGGLWNPADRTFGGWVDRDAGPFRFGVEVFQQRPDPRQPAGVAAAVRVGVRW